VFGSGVKENAREFEKEPECRDFLNILPHAYYDENMLHSILLSNVKNYEECIAAVEAFLPYVDNWACAIRSDRKYSASTRTSFFPESKIGLLPIKHTLAVSE